MQVDNYSGGQIMDVFVSGLKRALARSVVVVLALMQVLFLFPVQSAQAATLAVGDLVINEVLPSPDSALGQKESVEIYNVSAKSFTSSDLNTLELRDSGNTSFGDNWVTALSSGIAPGAYIVIEENSSVLNNTSNDSLTLKTDTLTLDSSFAYTATSGSPVTSGKSFARIPNGTGTFVAERTPTLGVANRAAPSVPAVPTIVPGDTTLTVNWSAVTDTVNYDLTIALTSAPAVTLASHSNLTGLTHTFTGLTNNQSYTVSLVAKNEVGSSVAVTASGTPQAAEEETPDPLVVSIVYRDVVTGSTVSPFGVTSIHAEVSIVSGELPSGVTPTITFARPGTDPQTITLTLVGSVWKTSTPFVITKANSPQDGTVVVSVATGNVSNSIVSGANFTVDTKVAAPTVSLAAMCAPTEDSVTVAVESDVVAVYVYRSASVDMSLVATNPGGAGTLVATILPAVSKTTSIGNNTDKVYLVAVDALKNVSSLVTVENDIAATVPTLQVEASDKKIIATWDAVSGATHYVFKWRKSDGSPWQEKTVTSTRQEITADNNIQYDIAVASVDAACNQSDFAVKYATPRSTTQITALGRGGLVDAERAYFSQPLMIAEVKDGPADTEVKPTSPYSLAEDKDQNGIKDSEEDKNGNGIKDGEENNEGDGTGDASTRDRSRLIVTIAILLILAGTALAAYSWYQGDDAPVVSEKQSTAPVMATEENDAPKTESTSEAATSGEEKSAKTAKKGTKGKRKTRW